MARSLHILRKAVDFQIYFIHYHKNNGLDLSFLAVTNSSDFYSRSGFPASVAFSPSDNEPDFDFFVSIKKMLEARTNDAVRGFRF